MSTLKVTNIESPSGGGISAKINDIGGGQLSNRNLIINGAFNVAQRATSDSVTGGDSGYQTVDRWLFDASGLDQFSGVVKQQPITDLPGFKTAFRVDTNTTAETAIEADDRMLLYQEIEAQNLQHLNYGTNAAQTITCSFWVKASVTGTFALGLYASDGNRILGSTYTINSADTWEHKTLTFVGDTAGTINNDNGAGLRWQFTIAAGSDYNSTDNTSWGGYSAGKLCYGHVQNGVVTNLDGYWQVTGCQMEVGNLATSFEHRSYGDELVRCQRYYYEVCNPDIAREALGSGTVWTAAAIYFTVNFPTTMRAYPSFTGFTAGNGPGYLISFAGGTAAYSNDSDSILSVQRLGVNGSALYTTYFVDSNTGVGGSVVTLTPGHGAWVEKFNANLRVNFNAEL